MPTSPTPIEMANIIVIVIGALSSIIAAVATYRNATSSSVRETRRIGLEEKRLISQERFDEISVAERAQQMLIGVTERQEKRIDELKIRVQTLDSEVNELKDFNKKLFLQFYNFINKLEDSIREHRKGHDDESPCNGFVELLLNLIEEERNTNIF